MKAEEKDTLEELAKMEGRFPSLQPHELYPEKYKVETLHVNGYGDLLFTVRALLNLCTRILENGDLRQTDMDQGALGDIEEALKLAAMLMPIDEGDLLDSVRKLIENQKSMKDDNDTSTGKRPDGVSEPTLVWNHLKRAS